MRGGRAHVGVFVICAVMLAGCVNQPSPFAKAAGNASSELAAAATTLTYLHHGKLTRRYAQSSFQAYQHTLKGMETKLPTLSGAPDERQIHQLLSLYQPAAQAVMNPCLSATCDWQQQVKQLHQASQALQQAGGG